MSIFDWAVGCSQNVRLRSANRGNSYNTWNVNTSGNVNNNNTNNANRFSPDCVAYRKRMAASQKRCFTMTTQGAECPAERLNNAKGMVLLHE